MAEPYIYVQGDRAKTPVTLASQPVGAKLVYVDPQGRDTPFTKGLEVVTSDADLLTMFTRRKASRGHGEG